MRRLLTQLAGLLAVGLTVHPHARADVVLLDEYWVPEIVLNDVSVTEVDALATGDATEAKSGEVSVRLGNQTGWPNVRFRQAVMLRLDQIPIDEGETEARLWYRTDGWQGPWRLEIWVYFGGAGPAPVKVLEADLDGGGEAGKFVTDDQWHQAKGALLQAADYALVPGDTPLVSYVWLAPTDGWNTVHRTYVDRVELVVTKGPLAGKPGPEPARRIRPKPGAQTNGPGWIWFEGEDALEHNFRPFGAVAPNNADEQKALSNGAWLESGGENPDAFATWQVDVPGAGRYAFWHRGNGTDFNWAWDNQQAGQCTVEGDWVDEVLVQRHAEGEIVVHWIKLGDVHLTAGKHMLRVEGLPDGDVFGFDCWLLTRGEFKPSGARKPGER
jgi:hypothetical protein